MNDERGAYLLFLIILISVFCNTLMVMEMFR